MISGPEPELTAPEAVDVGFMDSDEPSCGDGLAGEDTAPLTGASGGRCSCRSAAGTACRQVQRLLLRWPGTLGNTSKILR